MILQPATWSTIDSIATVEPAVRAQEDALTELVRRVGGRTEPLGASFWHLYDRTLAAPGGVMLRIGTVPSRLGDTFTEIRQALAGAAVAGCAALGALRARVDASDVTTLTRGIERLRAAVADVDGGVIVERGPRTRREAIDPWGPVPAPALAVMRAIKQEFDPAGALYPGRFVGGL